MAKRHGPGTIDERATAGGTVRYRARLRLADGRWRSETHATEDEADAWLYETARAIRRGTYTEPSRLTVAEVVREYLDRGVRRWRPSTSATYEQRVRQHLVPALGTVRVVDLTTHRVQAWIDAMDRQGLGPSFVESTARILSGALKEAVRLGVVERNVAVGMRLPAMKRTQREDQTWTAEQVRRVLVALDGDAQWSALYRLALSTGMRPGELRAVQWRDADLVRGVLHVRRTISRDADWRDRIGTTTKSGRERTVALSPSVVAALRAQRRAQAERQLAHGVWQETGLVFDRGDGGVIAATRWRTRHDRLCARVGVPGIRLHDLRHTAATLLLEHGVHPKVVSDLLGHSSVSMTLDRYSHPSAQLQRSAVDSLDTWLAEGTTT